MSFVRKIADFFELTDAMRFSLYPFSLVKFRGIVYRFKLKRCGWGTTFDKWVNMRDCRNIEIGEFCDINSFVHIWAGMEGVKIGSRVMIASHTVITTLTHDYGKNNMRFAPVINKGIVIEDDVWIGTHVVVMPGVRIAKGAVIGAGAIVNRDVPENAIIVGTPGRVLKYRQF